MIRKALFAAWLVALLVLSACSGSGAATPTSSLAPSPLPTQSEQGSPAATPTATLRSEAATQTPAAAPAATLTADQYQNPVIDADFADPDVLQVGDMYYAYATNAGDTNIQVAKSPDLAHWELLNEDALPNLPGWASQGFGYAWAPDVTTDASGKTFLMYFVAQFKIGAGGRQCIGVATSASPEGPFVPQGSQPLVCHQDEGGSIDAASFVDQDGERYLLWKNDANCCGGQTWIYIQPISEDGLVLQKEPIRLISTSQTWEGVLVEGPTLVRHEDKYYLFYSANTFNSPDYAVGYAAADKVLGPYTKPETGPLLETSAKAGIVGPGGQDVVTAPDGSTWIVFHSWSAKAYRQMNLARLDWQDGRPVVTGFEKGPHPIP